MRGIPRLHILILFAVFSPALSAQTKEIVPPAGNSVLCHDPPAGHKHRPPPKRQRFRNFVLDTLGPYPLLMAGFTAAIHQGTDNPPEWRQGAAALGKRFGSNMGITAVGNTTRFGLAALMREDTSFYRCACSGVPRRLVHAASSALLARKLSSGAPVFSLAALVAPYAATFTATYAWYPARYGAKDAFRMGNYNLLGTVGSNIAFEFIPRKAWRGLRRIHMASRRLAEQD